MMIIQTGGKAVMKIHYCLARFLASAALVPLVLASTCLGAVLNVPQYNQEKDQWCWNASSQMVLAFKGHSYSQTAIAQWAVGGQNIANYLYGSTDPNMHGCDEILSHFGSISSSGSASAMSLSNMNTEMANSRPVLIRWGWDSGGGHILVARGTDGNSVYLNDPWPDNGQSINSYSWVCQGGGHTWTHTLQISDAHDEYYEDFVVNYNQAMTYYSYYLATGSLIYRAYYNYYYAYACHYYYLYYNSQPYAYYYFYYYKALAYYYYDYYYYGGYSYGYSYSMSDYCHYLAYAYYYGYYYAGYYNAAYAYYYYYKAYEYYYYAYAMYYLYALYGDYSSANYYYNYYMDIASYYYNLYRQY